ncbi:MAG: 30S ribosomal protein S6 [Microgenomates group bacterium]
MSQYELTLLLSKKEDLETVKKIIDEAGASIVKEESWGEKTLAYPIKKRQTAFFFNFLLQIKPKDLLEFKRKLNFEEKILRYLLLLVDKK